MSTSPLGEAGSPQSPDPDPQVSTVQRMRTKVGCVADTLSRILDNLTSDTPSAHELEYVCNQVEYATGQLADIEAIAWELVPLADDDDDDLPDTPIVDVIPSRLPFLPNGPYKGGA